MIYSINLIDSNETPPPPLKIVFHLIISSFPFLPTIPSFPPFPPPFLFSLRIFYPFQKPPISSKKKPFEAFFSLTEPPPSLLNHGVEVKIKLERSGDWDNW